MWVLLTLNTVYLQSMKAILSLGRDHISPKPNNSDQFKKLPLMQIKFITSQTYNLVGTLITTCQLGRFPKEGVLPIPPGTIQTNHFGMFRRCRGTWDTTAITGPRPRTSSPWVRSPSIHPTTRNSNCRRGESCPGVRRGSSMIKGNEKLQRV